MWVNTGPAFKPYCKSATTLENALQPYTSFSQLTQLMPHFNATKKTAKARGNYGKTLIYTGRFEPPCMLCSCEAKSSSLSRVFVFF